MLLIIAQEIIRNLIQIPLVMLFIVILVLSHTLEDTFVVLLLLEMGATNYQVLQELLCIQIVVVLVQAIQAQ